MKRYRPLALTLAVFLVDQISKAWVVSHIPENAVGGSYLGDFLQIWHVRNDAVAFSMGNSFTEPVKIALFVIVPVVLIAGVFYVLLSDKVSKTPFQRWMLALFLGGAMGNLTDRIFRHLRVVDFMANRVYGLFGFEFWPTWNIADACLVVATVGLVISTLFDKGVEYGEEE